MPSRIVRLSTCDATRNAMRLGKFALMRPVMTFTLGRCVARMRWMPIARAFCASIASGVSTSPCTVIIRSASSSMIDDDVRQDAARVRRGPRTRRPCRFGVLSGAPSCTLAVEVLDVARAVRGEQLVALLHLQHRPLEHRRRVAVVGDDLVPQVRQRVVHRQLDHLRVDHQEAQRLRRVPVDEARDDACSRRPTCPSPSRRR